jgi:energy-coupling factor transport system permease protein
MAASADLYIPGQSWLHAADPRVKLLFAACAVLLLILCKNVFVMLAALALCLALHASARIPAQKILFVVKAVLPTALLLGALWVVFYPSGPALAQVSIIRITALGLAQGAVLAMRIVGMGLAIFAWLYTTSQAAIVRSLVKLGLPFEWSLALGLALRYIPLFLDMYGMISDAQAARGLHRAEGSGFRRVRGLLPVFVAMVISALRTGDQLALALEARALGARGVRRTYLRDFHFRAADYGLALAILAVTIGFVYFNLSYGFGAYPIQLMQ